MKLISQNLGTFKINYFMPKLLESYGITLLNATYKIFANALQKHLQPLLVEVIDNDLTAILPLHIFLDNILLTHESIQWAKESHQNSIFFKLDFNKTYDIVD